jgi:uncharacterized protein
MKSTTGYLREYAGILYLKGVYMEFNSLLAGIDTSNVFVVAALVLGGLMMVAGVVAVLLTITGIVLSLVFFKTREILIPGATLFILSMFEAPIRYMLWVIGIEEDVVSRLIVEVRNLLYHDRYERTPYSQRAIFIPQCLRSPHCPAPLTPEGIRCLGCGKCGIGKLKDDAEALGYKFFISPGSSLVKRMVKKYRPKAVLGVGCPMEVKEGTEKMASYGLPVQGVILDRDGCVDTRVDVSKLLEKIMTHHIRKESYAIESDAPAMKKAVEISDMWREDIGPDMTASEKKPAGHIKR